MFEPHTIVLSNHSRIYVETRTILAIKKLIKQNRIDGAILKILQYVKCCYPNYKTFYGSHLFNEDHAIQYVNDFIDFLQSFNYKTSPIQTVTKTELIPGDYGRIRVIKGNSPQSVGLSFLTRSGKPCDYPDVNITELKDIISNLQEIVNHLEK